MAHADEYHDNMVTMLELVWGEGYMAPGGPGNVARMLSGIETQGRRLLDIGCGIGGPACEMARAHGADVTGIDLEASLVERANRRATDLGIASRCRFQKVELGPLPFDDASFDIVTSAGALTQTGDKASLFGEIRRVLKPGGYVSSYEWFRSDGEYSDDMRYWFRLEGLTYAMLTIEDFRDQLIRSGFVDVTAQDATDWYRRTARKEYERLAGELYPEMVALLGQSDADHFVENWRAMVVVIDKGEMRQGYCRGRAPGEQPAGP